MINSTNVRSNIFRLAALALIFHACSSYESSSEGSDDPRVGERGLVRFAGDDCSGSTTMAIGSTVVLVAEPVDESDDLPTGLEVHSTRRSVIEATAGDDYGELVLTAISTGEAEVELLDGEALYDFLAFGAEPAREVLYSAEDAVFAGGSFDLKIDEVYGACGEECPLIGGAFLEWSAEPADTLVLQEDRVDRWAHFSAGEAGQVLLTGAEPSTGAELVGHGLTIVSPETAGELDVRFLVQLPDETVLEDQPAPLEIPVGSLVLPQVTADTDEFFRVLLAGADVSWSVASEDGALQRWSEVDEDPPEGPIFLATEIGSATLAADVELLDSASEFQILVIDDPTYD